MCALMHQLAQHMDWLPDATFECATRAAAAHATSSWGRRACSPVRCTSNGDASAGAAALGGHGGPGQEGAAGPGQEGAGGPGQEGAPDSQGPVGSLGQRHTQVIRELLMRYERALPLGAHAFHTSPTHSLPILFNFFISIHIAHFNYSSARFFLPGADGLQAGLLRIVQ